MTRKLKPVHPGSILKNDFLDEMAITPYRLAKELKVSSPTVNEIVRGRRAVTADMALRLSRYFGTTAALWLNLQAQYDLEVASTKLGKKLEAITQRAEPAVPMSRERG